MQVLCFLSVNGRRGVAEKYTVVEVEWIRSWYACMFACGLNIRHVGA